MERTPNANRIHIGIFGNTNAGKSTLLNLMTGQDVSLVSEVSGTTTDPVKKAMEIQGVGPVLWIDTAGFQDRSSLGALRLTKSVQIMEQIDMAIVVTREESVNPELMNLLRRTGKPLFLVVNTNDEKTKEILQSKYSLEVVDFDREQILSTIRSYLSKYSQEVDMLEGMADSCSTVLLVMPQDSQAPKGRLILPQVQTIRALLEKNCITICVTQYKVRETLKKITPDLIITDSQIFSEVYALKPAGTKITSFSVLMAKIKGDINELVKGAKKISTLKDGARILIWESCTHAPKEEDIGTVKIPRLLKQRIGEHLQFTFARGDDSGVATQSFDLAILCGSCMLNRTKVLHRIQHLKNRNIAVTNYGLTIAALNGILEKIVY